MSFFVPAFVAAVASPIHHPPDQGHRVDGKRLNNVSSQRVIDWTCLFRNNSLPNWSWRTATVLVPAVFREWRPGRPPPWLVDQYAMFLYQRTAPSLSCYLPNVAYESGVYLHFIVQHWVSLPEYAVFVQADWFMTRPGSYPPLSFWQPACARQHGASWLPLGKRNSRWPPYTIIRDSSFWELEPTARPLAHGASHIASLVER